MKKRKIISIISVLTLGLTLTGCKAKISKFEEQLNKFEDLIDDSKIYTNDYKLEIKQTFRMDDDFDSINYTYKKDGNKIYAHEEIGDNLEYDIWYVDDEEHDYIRAVETSDSKLYYIYEKDEALNDVKSQKKSILQKAYNELYEAISECKLDDDDCSIDKKIFKDTYTFKAEIENDATDSEKIIKATLNEGRLVNFEMVEKGINTNTNKQETTTIKINIEYKNQTVSFNRTSDYVLTTEEE